MRLLRWRRPKTRLRELGEAEAYNHAYGDRTEQVRTVKLPPRRPRYKLRVSGEQLRQRFQERLDARREEES